ncbi:MAG TPA: hypothetical protein VH988_17825 [Thermoanaerobaculia bacterium]|jgi:hypothetical protein|nr:hypothetical protein [Thermoanaerobaculia bacterium]
MGLVRAVLIAPWVSVPVAVSWSIALYPPKPPTFQEFLGTIITGAIYMSVFGVPIAYFGTLVVGLPAYLLLRRANLHRLWIAAAIGFGVPFVFTCFGRAENSIPALSPTFFGVNGLAVSILFWLLAAEKNRKRLIYSEWEEVSRLLPRRLPDWAAAAREKALLLPMLIASGRLCSPRDVTTSDRGGRSMELVRAVLIAPWISVPVTVSWSIALYPPNPSELLGTIIRVAIYFLSFGLPIAYFGTLVVGLPIYLLLRRANLHCLWIVAATGFGVPFVFTWLGHAKNIIPALSPTFLGVNGLAVSIVFWWLANSGGADPQEEKSRKSLIDSEPEE